MSSGVCSDHDDDEPEHAINTAKTIGSGSHAIRDSANFRFTAAGPLSWHMLMHAQTGPGTLADDAKAREHFKMRFQDWKCPRNRKCHIACTSGTTFLDEAYDRRVVQ